MSATIASVPERTRQQRMLALERANEIRSARAVLKRGLRAGERGSIDLITDLPEFVLTMKVYDVLLATPKLGRVKAGRVLARLRISPNKTLGGMTARQRDELVLALRMGWN